MKYHPLAWKNLSVVPALLLAFLISFCSVSEATQKWSAMPNTELEQVWATFKATPDDGSGSATKALFQKLDKVGNPDMPGIEKLRQMKKAYGKSNEYSKFADVEVGIMKSIFQATEVARKMAWIEVSKNPTELRKYYAMGDIGSWINPPRPDFSMDVDFTAFAVKNANGSIPTAYDNAFLKAFSILIGTAPVNCDVVVTTSGNEASAGVFVSKGGQKFAIGGMGAKMILINGGQVSLSKITTENLIQRKLIAEMRNDDRMKQFFDPKDPNPQKLKTLTPDEADAFSLAMEKFYPDALDFLIFTSVDASPAIQDFTLQLWDHVIKDTELSQRTRVKRAAKYASRGAQALELGMAELRNKGIDISKNFSPGMQRVAALARKIDELRGTDLVAYEKLLKKNFGQPPDSNKVSQFVEASHALLKFQAELTHKGAILDVLSMNDGDLNNKRRRALEDLRDQYKTIQEQAKNLKHDDLIKNNELMLGEVNRLLVMEEAGNLKGVSMLLDEQIKVGKHSAAKRAGVLNFLDESTGGKILADPMRLFLEENNPFFKPRSLTPGNTVDALKTVIEYPFKSVKKEVQDKGATMVALDYMTLAAQCLEKYTDAVNTDKSAFNGIAEVIMMEVISRKIPYFSLLYSSWQAYQAGDKTRLFMIGAYALAPPAMIPELLKGIGDISISVGQTWMFDAQLEALYRAAVFEPADNKEPEEWKTPVADKAGVIQYTYKSFNSSRRGTYDGVDGLYEFYQALLHKEDVGTAYEASGNEMQDGITFVKNMALQNVLLAMTVQGKHSLFNRDEGLKKLIAALYQVDTHLARFEKFPPPYLKQKVKGANLNIVLNTTRDDVENYGDIKDAVETGDKPSLQIVIDNLVEKRTDIRDKLLQRMAQATAQTFEQRKRAEYLVKRKILSQTVYEQLEEAAKILHVEKELLSTVNTIVNNQLAKLDEKDKGKIQFTVNQWVSSYNQLKNIRIELINLGLSLGMNKGVLNGPAGPLARIPPLQMDPVEDLKMGKRAQRDFGMIVNLIGSMLDQMAGGDRKGFHLEDKDRQALIRLRFNAMVEEFWFRGAEGAYPQVWTTFEQWPETDEAFKARVESSIDGWKSWLPESWQDSAEMHYSTHKMGLMDYAKEFNQLRNKVWADYQLTLKTTPSPLLLQPGGSQTLGLIPLHPKASFKWRLQNIPAGLKLTGAQSGTVAPGSPASQILKIQADDTIQPGKYSITLLLGLVKGNSLLKIKGPDGELGKKIITIPVTIGELKLSDLTIKVLGNIEGKKTDIPVERAEVMLQQGNNSFTLTEILPGIYRAPKMQTGSYRIDVKKDGERITQNWDAAQNNSAYTIYLPVKKKAESQMVRLIVQDKSDQSRLDDVKISITHPDKSVTLHNTQSGKTDVLLPTGAYMFSLIKDGYKERITRKNSTGSGILIFELVSTQTIFTSTEQKFLKFAITPTSINMRSGEQRTLSATALMMKGPAVIPKNVSTEATWTSKNPQLLAVSAGIIKSLGGSGVAAIEARYSPDPKLAPMTASCQVRIEEKAPDLPKIRIEVTPDKPTYKPGDALAFNLVSSDPTGPWEYIWYMGNTEHKGQQTTFTFADSGKYTVTAIIRSTIDPKKEDAVRKSIEISSRQSSQTDNSIAISPGPPYTSPANVEIELKGAEGERIQWRINGKDVRRGLGKWAWTFKEKGTHTIKATYWQTHPVKSFSTKITIGGEAPPTVIASQINKFDHIQEKGTFHIRSSYWREQDTGFGDWTKFTTFDNIGSCRNSLITTGAQANGYNAGWVIYVPTGKNEVRFKVYGFNFGNYSGRDSYQGTLDLHNKTIDPESLQFAEVHANEVIVEWKATDGSMGRVRIHKYSSQAPVTNSGMHEIAFTEPRKTVEEKPADFKKIAPGVFFLTDRKTHLTRVRIGPPCEYVLANVVPVQRRGAKDFNGIVGREGILKLYSSFKHHGDWLMRLTQGTYTLPYPGQADTDKFDLLGVKNYIWSKDERILTVTSGASGKSPMPVALSSSGASTNLTRPIIAEVVYKSSRWPIRLQDGHLEIQGERTGHYPWHKQWIQLGTDVESFKKFGTREGPLVVFKTKNRWNAVMLDYASGKREKEYSSNKKIALQRGATYGAVLLIEERCYEFTPNKVNMAEVDCDSGMYIGSGL